MPTRPLSALRRLPASGLRLSWPAWADAEYRHWLLHTLLKNSLKILLFLITIMMAVANYPS